MPNITATAIVSAPNSDANFVASVISNNYTHIAGVVNNGGLDSFNYGASAIESTHISRSQVVSQHLASGTDAPVVKGKIASEAVLHAYLNFASSDAGVQVVRAGSATGTSGVQVARVSKTFNVAIAGGLVSQEVFPFSWATDAADGNPSFSTAPVVLGMPTIKWETSYGSATAGAQWADNRGFFATDVNSAGATFIVVSGNAWNAAFTETVTMNFVVAGPV